MLEVLHDQALSSVQQEGGGALDSVLEAGALRQLLHFPFSSGHIPLTALKQALLSARVLPSVFPAHWILNELQNAVDSNSLGGIGSEKGETTV